VLMQGWLMTREAPCEVRENGAGGSSREEGHASGL